VCLFCSTVELTATVTVGMLDAARSEEVRAYMDEQEQSSMPLLLPPMIKPAARAAASVVPLPLPTQPVQPASRSASMTSAAATSAVAAATTSASGVSEPTLPPPISLSPSSSSSAAADAFRHHQAAASPAAAAFLSRIDADKDHGDDEVPDRTHSTVLFCFETLLNSKPSVGFSSFLCRTPTPSLSRSHR
jgi:hypothetical protein